MDPLQLGTPWAPGNDPDLDPREGKPASFGMLCSLRRFEPVLGTTHVVTRVFTELADALFSSVSVRIPFSGWLASGQPRGRGWATQRTPKLCFRLLQLVPCGAKSIPDLYGLWFLFFLQFGSVHRVGFPGSHNCDITLDAGDFYSCKFSGWGSDSPLALADNSFYVAGHRFGDEASSPMIIHKGNALDPYFLIGNCSDLSRSPRSRPPRFFQ